MKNETILSMRGELEKEAKELLGMAMVFALAEKLKQLLDSDDGSTVVAVAAAEADREDEKPRNHQVGEPLITQGTRCTENVFLEWREVRGRTRSCRNQVSIHFSSFDQKWLEKRALQLAERRRQQEEAADGKPTGKQLFLAARDDDKAARALLSQLIADENVDESLFS